MLTADKLLTILNFIDEDKLSTTMIVLKYSDHDEVYIERATARISYNNTVEIVLEAQN